MEFEFDQTSAVMAGYGESVLGVSDRLLGAIREQLGRRLDNMPAKQAVLDAAAAAYDRYIAPLDIPGVPAALEPWVDSMLKAVFLRLVGAIYDSLQGL